MQSKSFVRNIIKGITGRINGILENPNKKAGLNWFKIKVLKHIYGDKIKTYNFRGRDIYYVNAQDLLHGLKEIFVEEVYKVNLPSKPYIIDCGANIGLSLIYLKEKHKDAEIRAFEPDERNFQLLSKNVHSFDLKNIYLEKKAVWISDTTLQFSNQGNMGSKIETGRSEGTINVEAIQLKNIINKQVDFLKIDIEGAEYEVLKDLEERLNFVQNMFVEYHGTFNQNDELLEILNIIRKAGFNFYIKEAAEVYGHPFLSHEGNKGWNYDIQLNIFCFRNKG